MKLTVYTKGTKLRLTKDWEFIIHEDGVKSYFTKNKLWVLPAGTVISLHDIDIRGNAQVPQSVTFYICKKGCPSNPRYEQTYLEVSFDQLEELEFEFNSKADKELNSFASVVESIKAELKN